MIWLLYFTIWEYCSQSLNNSWSVWKRSFMNIWYSVLWMCNSLITGLYSVGCCEQLSYIFSFPVNINISFAMHENTPQNWWFVLSTWEYSSCFRKDFSGLTAPVSKHEMLFPPLSFTCHLVFICSKGAEKAEQLQYLVSKLSMMNFWFVLSKGIYPYNPSTCHRF